MPRRRLERRDVWLLVGSGHLELHHAGVGQTYVGGRMIRRTFEHPFEHMTRANDLVALECFKRSASFDPCAVRCQQLFERVVTRT